MPHWLPGWLWPSLPQQQPPSLPQPLPPRTPGSLSARSAAGGITSSQAWDVITARSTSRRGRGSPYKLPLHSIKVDLAVLVGLTLDPTLSSYHHIRPIKGYLLGSSQPGTFPWTIQHWPTPWIESPPNEAGNSASSSSLLNTPVLRSTTQHLVHQWSCRPSHHSSCANSHQLTWCLLYHAIYFQWLRYHLNIVLINNIND